MLAMVHCPMVQHLPNAPFHVILCRPSMMKSNDRDAISHARLFRFNVVANGFPGAVIDNTGKFAKDTTHHSNGMVTGTLDLDGEWAHENGQSPAGHLISTPINCTEQVGAREQSAALFIPVLALAAAVAMGR